jgi:hypothetical protein
MHGPQNAGEASTDCSRIDPYRQPNNDRLPARRAAARWVLVLVDGPRTGL